MKLFLDLTATREYYLKADIDKTVVWILAPLDSQLVMYLSEKYGSKKEELEVRNFAFMTELVRFGLKDIKSEGVIVERQLLNIPYLGQYDVVSDSFLKKLEPKLITEIATEILRDNFLSGDEKKS